MGRAIPKRWRGRAVPDHPQRERLAGFWTGILWLAYEATREPVFRQRAEALLSSFARRFDDRVHLIHDLGFLFSLSAVVEWRLTGNQTARELALRAAGELLARYRPQFQAIQAWDGEENAGRIIIDSMMNLPLLFWASVQSGDERYRKAAASHAEASCRRLLRPDGATYHTFFFGPKSGEPVGPRTHQEWADSSLWARDQAWAIGTVVGRAAVVRRRRSGCVSLLGGAPRRGRSGPLERNPNAFPAAGLIWHVPLEFGPNEVRALGEHADGRTVAHAVDIVYEPMRERAAARIASELATAATPSGEPAVRVSLQLCDSEGVPVTEDRRRISLQLHGPVVYTASKGRWMAAP